MVEVLSWHGRAWLPLGTGPLNFTDDLKYHDNSWINLEEYKNHLAYQYSRKCHQIHWKVLHIASGQWPKTPASSVKESTRTKKWKVLDFPSQSPDLNPIEHEFHQAEEESKSRNSPNKQQLELAALKAGEVFQSMRPRVWWCLRVTDSLLWLCARDLQLNNSF